MMKWSSKPLPRSARGETIPVRALGAQTTMAVLFLVLALALPGCDQPAGLGTIDVDAARQASIAQGRPDPLAAPGVNRWQIPPRAAKQPRSPRR